MAVFTRVATFELNHRKASPEGGFACVVSTETPVQRPDGRGGSFAEVLSHDADAIDLRHAPLPLCEGHDTRKVNVGIVRDLRVGPDRKLRGTVILGQSARGRELANDIAAGIVSGISVGYYIEKIQANEDGSVRTATRWTPREVSLVSMPADRNAGIGRSKNMSVEKDSAAIVQAERNRASAIKVVCRALGDTGAALAEQLINDGVEEQAARNMVLDALAARSDASPISNHAPEGSGIGRGRDDADQFAAGVSASLFARSGDGAVIEACRAAQGNDDRAFRLKRMGFGAISTDPAHHAGSSLFDIARQCLERRGVRTYGLSKTQIADKALMQRNGEATVSDFSVLYENVMNKTLMAAYGIIPDSWRLFCKSDQVQDFRPSNRYRVGSFGTMPVVAEGAEFLNVAVPDGAKTAITTETKGQIIALSRQAIINDDLSANVDLAARLGRGFAMTIEKEVYALLAQNSGLGPTQADSQPFFHTNRANSNGTGSALSVAGLEADRVIMGSQLDQSSNDYLGLRPSVLLVPLGLEGEANVLNRSLYDPTAGSAFERPNIVGGLFSKTVGTPRISGTRRYLFADPGIAPAIVVAFLASSGESPFLEQRLGFRVDGIEWKARLDFKAQMFDPKGAVTNAGA